jgi:hypothetical protein
MTMFYAALDVSLREDEFVVEYRITDEARRRLTEGGLE